MRLQLTSRRASLILLALASLVLTGEIADAQEYDAGEGSVSFKGSLYADDDRTLITTTFVDGAVGLPAATKIGAHALIDVVSSASVDVVSAATPRFDEVRLELGARAGVRLASRLDAELSFAHSWENDWRSYAPRAALGLDLFKRNTRLTLAYGFVYNQVGRASDPTFSERLDLHTFELGVTQLIDKKTLVGASYTFQMASGWQASPYRYVTVGSGHFSLLERHPQRRLRHAATVNGLRLLKKGVALAASYRFYVDGWGLSSHTWTAALRLALSEPWSARLRVRAYYQTAVSFWQETYAEAMRYMSADRELSTFWDLGGGFKVGWHDERWSIDVKVDGIYYRFLNFARLKGRVALVSNIGAGVKW